MEKAIVTGATGLVGSAVARHVADRGVDVLCLGRRDLSGDDVSAMFGSPDVTYLRIAMDDIESLPDAIGGIGWRVGDSCVFFNFAWGGAERLTDGGFEIQFNNAVQAALAVSAAKKAGCSKFVNAGTVEETFAEEYLAEGAHGPFGSTQTDYAISKLAARDMCKMVAYLDKIDYVHTRLSVPVAERLDRGGYVCSALDSIIRDKPYDEPANDQLFDIVPVDDVAEAYYRIGQRGRNKADYFIGTGKPRTLRDYFAVCRELRDRRAGASSTVADDGVAPFLTGQLTEDTGFVPSRTFEEFVLSRISA